MSKSNYTTMRQVVKKAKKAFRENGRSWTKAALSIGVSRGTLIRVANGYEPKDPIIRRALGLNVYAVVATCRRCGQVHVSKRCTQKATPKTFEDNCREYDAWISNPKTQQQLNAMLEWAETPRERRSKLQRL